MIQRDIDALTNRLFDNMDVDALNIRVENEADAPLNGNELWTRWVVLPGISTDASLGPDRLIEQHGTATLQIFTPKGQLTGPGGKVRDEFNALFRGWRSADGKLIVRNMKSESSTYNADGQEYHLINAKLFWHSRRRTSDA